MANVRKKKNHMGLVSNGTEMARTQSDKKRLNFLSLQQSHWHLLSKEMSYNVSDIGLATLEAATSGCSILRTGNIHYYREVHLQRFVIAIRCGF
jgi:hypothetical protein